MKQLINSFDIDGVIFMGKDLNGLYPSSNDIIITGRSYEEEPETLIMLEKKGITNRVFYNSTKFIEKTRQSSGLHKAITLRNLIDDGIRIGIHFEDDDIQANIIKQIVPEVNIVMIVHDLTEKENIRHSF